MLGLAATRGPRWRPSFGARCCRAGKQKSERPFEPLDARLQIRLVRQQPAPRRAFATSSPPTSAARALTSALSSMVRRSCGQSCRLRRLTCAFTRSKTSFCRLRKKTETDDNPPAVEPPTRAPRFARMAADVNIGSTTESSIPVSSNPPISYHRAPEHDRGIDMKVVAVPIRHSVDLSADIYRLSCRPPNAAHPSQSFSRLSPCARRPHRSRPRQAIGTATRVSRTPDPTSA